MGALAGMLREKGFRVSGSDTEVYPPMSTALEAAGIAIQNGYRAENLAPRPDLVIIGNAVSRHNPEVEAVMAQGIPYLSMPEVLDRFFLAGHTPIVIAGTHGKTTTASLTAWILHAAGLEPSFFIGGVLQNFAKNYGLGKGEPFVIEGDEYDTAFFDKGPKFLHYRPEIAVITALEFDHADIYADLAAIETQVSRFIALLKPDAPLFFCTHYPKLANLVSTSHAELIPYGLKGNAVWTATHVSYGEFGTRFELVRFGESCGIWHSPLSGEHNLLNTLAAIGVAHALSIPDKQIQEALSRFEGVKRRQELRGIANGIAVIDDFAHHPTAVRETLAAVRGRYPKARIWALFEPRSNSSIRDVFQAAYGKSFDAADRVAIAPIHRPEKVKDGHVLDVSSLVHAVNAHHPKGKKVAASYPNTDAIVDAVKAEARSGDVILVMSNGGFDNIHKRLLEAL